MPAFEVIPAVDVLGGRCVRLAQGRFDAVTDYGDPAEIAARFAAHPLRRLHVVDLDGARSGAPQNRSAIQQVLEAVRPVPVQLGGGVRDRESISAWLELGIERVVLGTAALRDPALVQGAARDYPGRIAVGIDARDGRVAVSGWLETSDTPALELALRFQDAGVAALIYTDIARDGMGTGPNLASTKNLAEGVDIPVIASGGVGRIEDIRAAARCEGLAGVIVGRALLAGAIDPAAALEEAAC